MEEGEEEMSGCMEYTTTDPCSFYVTRVPESVFSVDLEETLRPEFEAVFRVYSEDVRFDYLRSFGRVRVTYPSPEQAERAETNLNNHEFQGSSLRVQPVKAFVLGSQTLDIPQRSRQFLISPPASPPYGWEPVEEKTPCFDFSLVTALARLQLPGMPHEVHEATPITPSIIVTHHDEEEAVPSVLREEPKPPLSSLPPHLRHTTRPPLTSQATS